jgi:tetratricopeptide (TPR) repeat protein
MLAGSASTMCSEDRPVRDPLPQLRADLRALHRALGSPSYRQLAALCPDGSPSRQTIGNLLTKSKLQSWRTVREVVLALQRYAKREKLGQQPPGTFDLSQWENRYREERYGDDAGGSRSPVVTEAGNGLPAAVDVVGRTNELSEIADLLAAGGPGRPTTVVVVGMAGVGKTALALRAAHEAWSTSTFADALYTDLQGYDPERRITPHVALGSLLVGLDVPSGEIREGQAERVAQWRRVLAERASADRRVLVVVDNAFSAADVDPFLPGVGDHRVLVTSRHTLADLRDLRLFELRVLSRDESVAMLTRALAARVRDRRTEEEPAQLAQVAELCGDLPLALAISAALLVIEPDMPVAQLAAELTDSASRLSTLDSGDNRAVRAAFFLSYRHLHEAQARLFRMLALHPGTQLAADSAGALANIAIPWARQLLRLLRRAHLLEPGIAGTTYRFHDLVRDYAVELVDSDTEVDRETAQDRLYEYYANATDDAKRHLLWIGPQVSQMGPGVFWIGMGDPPGKHFESKTHAQAWLDIERSNLVAAILAASVDQRWRQLCAIAANLHHYMQLSLRVDDALAVFETALAASTHLTRKDRMIAAIPCADAYRIAARYPEALQLLVEAGEIARSMGEKRTEASIQHNLGLVHHRMGNYIDAEACHRFDLEFCRRNGDVRGAAQAMNALGDALRGREEFDEAIYWLRAAIKIFRTLGDRRGEALAQGNLALLNRQYLPNVGLGARIVEQCEVLALDRREGATHSEARDYLNLARFYFDRCGACHADSILHWSSRSMEMAQELGDQELWARALGASGLGHVGARNVNEAKAALEQAAVALRQLGFAEHSEEFETLIRACDGIEYADEHHEDGMAALLDELPHAVLRGDAETLQNARDLFRSLAPESMS